MPTQITAVPADVQSESVVRWKIKRRQAVNPTTLVCILERPRLPAIDIHAPGYGWVTALVDDSATVTPKDNLFTFEPCGHHIVMKDLCAECGANLRREGGGSGERAHDASASIPMVHSIPDLHVSESIAAELALQDEQSLLLARKLVLLVDLDETLLHTTNDPQAFRYTNVQRYRLPGSPLVYHTSFRPHLQSVLERLSKYYQMHICTFGNRVYAHQLAAMIDPKRRYFANRILSRDECFDPATKSANLKALFPRGLNLVCIIDDRGEVWDWSPHLVQVKPYRFFEHARDLNTFPWSTPNASSFPNNNVNQDSSQQTDDPPKSECDSTVDKNAPTCDDASDKCTSQTTPVSTQVTPSEPVQSEPAVQATLDTPTEAPIKSNGSPPSTGTDTLSNSSPQDSTPLNVVDTDGDYLLRLQDILISLHRSYYLQYDQWLTEQGSSRSPSISSSQSSQPPTPKDSTEPSIPASNQTVQRALPNLATIIAQHRSSVLGPTCHITLSGLTPSTHLPELCFAGRVVRSLGAVLHGGLRLPPISAEQSTDKQSVEAIPENKPQTEYTTHLVACRRGTEKYNAALKFLETAPSSTQFRIVSPQWLWACHFNWEHMNESAFPLVQDFHPSEFDPEVEPVPGTWRYWRRSRRSHHQSEHSPPVPYTPAGAHRYHIHKHSRHRHHRRHRKPIQNDSLPSNRHPQLDIDLVKSAWDSIREELSLERQRKRRSRQSIDDHRSGKRDRRTESETLPLDKLTSPPTDINDVSSNSSCNTSLPIRAESEVIQDVGEEENLAEDLEMLIQDERTLDEESVLGKSESESTSEETNLQDFLPPPKPLILADNPLMHLPPQATSQMLAEIEDAVMEEDTERASSVPPEAELFDPATIGLGDDTSSSAGSDTEICHTSMSLPCRTQRRRKRRTMVPRDDWDRKTLHWQVKRELLIRRRRRASPGEARHIDRKLRRIDAKFRSAELRQRSMDDLFLDCGPHATRHAGRPTETDSEESEDDIWDSDYPKGWNPDEQEPPVHTARHPRSVSLSPAIHSDPELVTDWWQSPEELEYRDWNTCPEGYDYEDAERARTLLGRDQRASDLRAYAQQLHGTHPKLVNCLFGTDDEADDTSSTDSSVGEDFDDPDDLSDERWRPLREFM